MEIGPSEILIRRFGDNGVATVEILFESVARGQSAVVAVTRATQTAGNL